MNKSRLIIAAAVLAFTGALAHAADKAERLARHEARLAEMLKGRTAGEPVSLHSRIPVQQARSDRRRGACVWHRQDALRGQGQNLPTRCNGTT